MNIRFRPLAAAAAAWLTIADSAPAGELSLSADTPDVTISTRPVGRNFMRLPELEYKFVIEPDCDENLSAESVSLSIADTRVLQPVKDLAPGNPLQVSVAVPASQIGPVAVDSFCVAREDNVDAEPANSMRIPSVLSVQAALLCVSETSSEITYTSESLDVVLHCEHSVSGESAPEDE